MEQSCLEAIPRRSIKEEVVRRIREAIERGELSPGEQITELGLGKKFGVGQPAIREALLELQFLGFVERVGPRKTCITSLTERRIREIYVVRIRLESLAVELLAGDREADLAECERQVDSMRAMAAAGQIEAFYAADLGFHRAMWRATQNRSLTEALEPLVARLFAFGVIQHAHPTPAKMCEIAEEHAWLLDCIQAGDVQAASRMIESSLQRAREDDLEA